MLILLLSASGLSGVQIAHKIGRDIQVLRKAYSYSIYPTLHAENQRHAILKAVEYGVFSLSQAQKSYVWDEREPLSDPENVAVHCLLRYAALSEKDVARRVPCSFSDLKDNLLKAKVKLRVDNDVQLCVITLAALATVIDLAVAPLPDETELVCQNLALFEGVPYPYPQQWHDFVAGAAALFPPTLKH